MCCRYVLRREDAQTFLAQVGALLAAGALPASRYNIPPGAGIPAVRNRPRVKGERELASLHWGLVPAWARTAAEGPVNARAESLAEKPTFRDAVRTRRCLIPASGFYEWKPVGRAREPWLFRLRDDRPFALAGLWAAWRSPTGEILESCAVVTTVPNALMQPVHHRMPVLLADPAAWDAWLDPRLTEPAALAPLLEPFPAAAMTAIAVSPRVNQVRHDDPDCLLPAPPTPAPEAQLGFGF